MRKLSANHIIQPVLKRHDRFLRLFRIGAKAGLFGKGVINGCHQVVQLAVNVLYFFAKGNVAVQVKLFLWHLFLLSFFKLRSIDDRFSLSLYQPKTSSGTSK
ncbi:MAG: hypothetical protein K9J51_11610 [Desulfotignum sp.]|nr:hypothetical protein [Desulfotignum sp.]